MRLAAAAIALSVLALVACGGDDGVLTVDEARDYGYGDQELTIRGALVVQYGSPMICNLESSSPPRCRSGYWVKGPLPTDLPLKREAGVLWAEEVTLHGVLDEGIFTLGS